jgi:hypothetical protein
MKLLGIEFGGNREVVNNETVVKGENEYIKIREGYRTQKVKQGVGMLDIQGKTSIIKKNGVIVDAYEGLIDL